MMNENDRDVEVGSDSGHLAMSPQQRKFTGDGSRSGKYRELIVGRCGWGYFLLFELYNVFLAGLGSALGIVLRGAALRWFLRSLGKGTVIGRDVTIRQPHRVSIGKATIIDDSAVIDVRTSGGGEGSIEIGDHVLIGRNSLVTTKGGSIKLGNACNISSFCRVATRSKVEIGESVLVAAYVYIGCGNHSFEDPSVAIIEQPMDVRGGVMIGERAWIGTKATILDGVTIGRNAVVGAHSLVREDVPDNAIVAGVPARLVRMREG